MQIQQAFRTSKGIFISKEVANKKGNRAKLTDERNGSFICFEQPVEIYVICANGKFFQLEEVKVNF